MIFYFLLFFVSLFIVRVINKNPHYWFWLLLMLFFDPGGFFEGYFSNEAIGPLNFSDLFFVVMLISIISVKNQSVLSNDKDFKKIFYYILFFQFYYILTYGFLVPYVNERLDFFHFIQKNRMYFMSLPIMYGVYVFSNRSLIIFFNLFVYFSFMILILYFVTLIFKIPIVPILEMERYYGSGIQRISMLSYGLIVFIFPLGIIMFLLKNKLRFKINNERIIFLSATLMLFAKNKLRFKINNERIIFLSATLMLFAELLTLTRRQYLSVIISIFLIILIFSYVFQVSKIRLAKKIIFPTLFLILLIGFVFPKQLENFELILLDTISTILTGRNIQGDIEYRVTGTGDLLYVKQFISENIFWGIGYIPYTWADIVYLKKYQDPLALSLDASAEVPIYGAFMRLGVVGVLIASGIYFILLKNLFKFSKIIKSHVYIFNSFNTIEIIFIFLVIYYLISHFTINAYALFGVFYSPHGIPLFAVFLGLFYSLKNKCFYIFNKEKI